MDTSNEPGKSHEDSLYRRFTQLAIILTTIMAAAYIIWNIVTQDTIVEDTVLVEARAMTEQMQATWNYIDTIQDTVNYDKDGSYNFRGIYCATAAKQIAGEITDGSSGYVIRYVRKNPRNIEDAPDEFELKALETFKTSDAREYYDFEGYGTSETFRYIARLDIAENCLECHGKPAGSRDPTGGYREGKQLGDLAGASSIVIPLDGYRTQAASRTISTLVFFGVLLLLFVIFIRKALSKWVVMPMRKTNQELEKANAAKSDFLTLMSHELRTPLSSIIAFTDIWEHSRTKQSEDEQYLVREIKDNSEVLLGMVNNLIDTAKVEAGRYELSIEAIDVLDVIDVARSTVEPLAMSKGIHLKFAYTQEIVPVLADWEALRKILTNLLGNAVKFTQSGGTVSVTASRDTLSNMVTICVQDTGCGIPKDDLERIFERFEQVKPLGSVCLANAQTTQPGSKTAAQGSGLGLTLSRTLAQMMGGTLTVASEQGVGSAFTVMLPCFEEPDQEYSGQNPAQ